MSGPAKYINYVVNNGSTVPLWLNDFISDPVRTLLMRLGLDTQAAGSYPIIPTVIEWPIASDVNGVAYPAGIVGVVHAYDYTLSATDNFENNVNAQLIAVPDTLDTGSYSPRWETDHRNRSPEFGFPVAPQHGVYGQASPTDFGLPFFDPWSRPYSIPTAQALTPYGWMPNNNGNWGVGFTITTGWTTYNVTGFRYIRISGNNDTGIAQTLRIARNADGSTTGIGDTTLYTQVIPTGVFDTGFLMHNGTTQDWHSPLGLLSYFFIAAPGFGTTPTITCGPRLDIPLPYLATSATRVIPGGIWIGAGIPGYP